MENRVFQADSYELHIPRQKYFESADWREPLHNIDQAILDPDFLIRFQATKPDLHALIRNTCSITMLAGSGKINVVPPIASAEIDCRILPDQNAEEFLDGIKARIDDDHVRVEEIMLFGPAQSSSDTDLYRLLASVSKKHYPNAGVIAAVQAGFTDSHFFRDLGIISYGYGPYVIPEEDLGSVHGNNERIGIDTFNQGIEMMIEVVTSFTSQSDL